jgi:hypothetical protein
MVPRGVRLIGQHGYEGRDKASNRGSRGLHNLASSDQVRIQRRNPSGRWIEDQGSSMVGDALGVTFVLPGTNIVVNAVLRVVDVVLQA